MAHAGHVLLLWLTCTCHFIENGTCCLVLPMTLRHGAKDKLANSPTHKYAAIVGNLLAAVCGGGIIIAICPRLLLHS
jgi:hypothetical protein